MSINLFNQLDDIVVALSPSTYYQYSNQSSTIK